MDRSRPVPTVLFYLILIFLIFPKQLFALDKVSSANITVSASIGENQVTITGFTSPSSRVILSSPKTYAVTYSDKTGYFEFNRTLLPKNPSDLCLSSLDDYNRQSTPVCIPPPPPTNYQTDIGPIILPPTIALNESSIKPGSTVAASGQSLPDSQIEIYFYKVDDNALSFPKSAMAYSLPILTTRSDSQGNFNLNLPTAYSSNYRLYVATKFQDNLSPKSNTLLYVMPSLIWLFWLENKILIIFLPLFIFTISFFIYLLVQNFLPQKHYLPAIRNFLPAIIPVNFHFPEYTK